MAMALTAFRTRPAFSRHSTAAARRSQRGEMPLFQAFLRPSSTKVIDGLCIKDGTTIEAGDGYSDIFIRTEEKDTGMIVEVKYAGAAQRDAACRKALKQIGDRGYARALQDDGCRTIYKCGIACCRKWCRVLMEREE